MRDVFAVLIILLGVFSVVLGITGNYQTVASSLGIALPYGGQSENERIIK